MDEIKSKRKSFWDRAFLAWQNSTGQRANLQDFAKYLDVGFTTLSGWINSGYTPGADVMRKIAARIGPEIYDVYGISLDQFEEMRVRTEAAISEIQQTLAVRSIAPDSDEGRALAREIFARWGFELRVTMAEKPVTVSHKT